jgi:hypothetical protein
MKTRLAAFFLALGLAATPAIPALAAVTYRDAQGVLHLNLNTQLVPPLGAGYYEGTLQLTVSKDGIVQGYYRPNGENFHPVTGGLNGDKIWLDISYQGGLHVDGVLKGGRIVGSTFIGTRLWDFNAAPQTN